MKTILAIAVLLACNLAHAATITRTLDFQDRPPGLDGHSNFNYGGLRFSPSCHIHNGHYGDEGQEQIWLQSDHDNSNCFVFGPDGDEVLPDVLPNPDFLGTKRTPNGDGESLWPNFYVDRFGEEFTLLGLAGVGFNGTAFTVESSNGGVFHGSVPWEEYGALPYEWFALSGPQWTDITWFTLSNTHAFGWQPHQGWDDIKYSYDVPEPVDEPTPLELFGWLMLGLGARAVLRKWF